MAIRCYAFSSPLPIRQKHLTSLHSCPNVSQPQPRHAQFCHPRCRPRLCSETPPPVEKPASIVPSSSDSSSNSEESKILIPGTPCFTSNILASPMPREAREVYLSTVTNAVDTFLTARKRDSTFITEGSTVAQAAWAVLSATVAEHSLRTRVLIQGRRAFGAIPLSVAGLRRTFDGDLALSASDWPADSIRSGDLEDENDVADDDDLILVLSPTNAVSVPIIDETISLVKRAGVRPVILLNPRLDDVPSHSGVMQVSGRAARIGFIDSIIDLLYLRVLFDPGASYPPRGILYHCWPGAWQIWRSENIDKNYVLISSIDRKPKPSEITDAFRADAFARRKKTSLESKDRADSRNHLLNPQLVAAVFAIGIVLAVLGGKEKLQGLLQYLK